MARKPTRRTDSGFAAAVEKEIEALPVIILDIEKIKDPKKHDRSTYDEDAIKSLAQNIKEEGLLQPIVVRQLDDGTYERVAGFRRIKAVLLNGEKQILARVIEAKNELSALKAMFSENTQREALNSYDKAVFAEEIIIAIMNETGVEALMNMSTAELKRRLTRMRNQKNNTIITDPTNDDIVFNNAIQTDVLPLYDLGIDALVGLINILDFNELIIEAIRSGKIGRSSAAEINKLAKGHIEHIPDAIERAYSDEMGKREVAEMVAAYLKTKKVVEQDNAKAIAKIFNFNKIPKERREEAEEITKRFIASIRALTNPSKS